MSTLPQAFAVLEPYAEDWARPTRAEHQNRERVGRRGGGRARRGGGGTIRLVSTASARRRSA